jgi:hypothetical protein
MLGAGVALASRVAVFALTGPGVYHFGTGADAGAMVKRVLGQVASRRSPFKDP